MPMTIDKPVAEPNLPGSQTETGEVTGSDPADANEAARQVDQLEERMRAAADNLEFELAASIRDRMIGLRSEHTLGAGDTEPGVPAPEEY